MQVIDKQQSSCVDGKCVCSNPAMVYFQNDANVWTGDPVVDSLVLKQDGCHLLVSNSGEPVVIVEGMSPPTAIRMNRCPHFMSGEHDQA